MRERHNKMGERRDQLGARGADGAGRRTPARRSLGRLAAAGCLAALLALTGACGGARHAAEVTKAADTDLRFDTVRHQRTTVLSEAEQFKYQNYFLEAVVLMQKEYYAAAYELLGRALAINPDADEALYEKLMIETEGNPSAFDSLQVCVLQRVVGLAPDNDEYKEMLADVYEAGNDLQHAAALCEMMSRKEQPTSELLYRLVELYERMGDYGRELATLDRIERAEGVSEATAVRKTMTLLLSGDTARAYAGLDTLCRRYPGDSRYRLMLANYYMEGKRMAEARRLIDGVLADDPSNALANATLLDYYRRQGPDSAYNAALDRALSYGNLPAYGQNGAMARLVQDFEQHRVDSTHFYRTLRRIVAQPQADARLAASCEAYLRAKHWDEDSIAPLLYTQLDVEPEDVVVRFRLLKYLVGKGLTEQIISVCRDGETYHPDQVPFYFYEGLGHQEQNNLAAALDAYRRGAARVDRQTDYALASDLYTIMGDTYYQLHQKSAAYAAYDSALIFNADNLLCLNNYAYFLSLDGKRLDRAAEMSRRTLEAEPENPTYLDTYAWVLFVSRRYAEAKKYIDKTLAHAEETPENAGLFEHAGDIYARLGQTRRAVGFWQTALRLSSDEATRQLLRKKIKFRKYIKP